MPLAPEAQALLDQMAALNAPPLHTLEPAAARAMFDAAPLPEVRSPVARTEDRSIPGPLGEIPVRIYQSPGDRGTLVFYHGGGFMLGGIESHDEVCHTLSTGAGCSIVAVDYRMAPEHPYPAAPEDAYAALVWVAENGDSLGLDTSRLAVGGDSAGGNLSAVVSVMARDRGGPELALQFLIYPAVDMSQDYPSFRENASGYMLDVDSVNYFLRHYAPDEARHQEPYLAPIFAGSHVGLPTALIQTAEFDPLRDQGKAYAEKLSAAGVAVTYTCYEGMLHGFYNFGFAWPSRADAVEEGAAALREAFAAAGVGVS
nr:lipase/esterase AS-Trib20-ORF1 [uncultured bacterium]